MTAPSIAASVSSGMAPSPAQTGDPGFRSLCVCVADVSADRHAARLIRRLKEAAPNLKIWGIGGSAMEAAGAQLLYNREAMAVLGLIEVLRYLPKLAKIRAEILRKVREEKPDAVMLMDAGGFNIGLATQIRKHNKDLPIIYFISPQVWGSRPWRINVIARAVTRMLVIFPFEEALYRSKGVPARFVGHPLTTCFKPESERQPLDKFCAQHSLDASRPIIGVFPGSRPAEIEKHAPVVLQAINWVRRERPDYQFVISTTNQVFADALYREIDRLGYNHLVGSTLKTISSEFNEELMTHSQLLWTKSGTTTLEATLIGTPMLIFYRANWISFVIFLMFKTVKNVGWPNLLAGEELVPELIQLDCRADKLVRYTLDWMDVPALRQELSGRLRELRSHLGEGEFTDNAATEILDVLGLAPVTAVANKP
ncbi:MAG: lipid-A-disaccharide synthase [Candidatus Obscuribacterales bacterium]|nr:lipid-A-disaccharide synthase [Candidatus Obscuribacterales bacterium]